jgi:drug/metabolite transporter (DMT)-like permease
VTADQTTSTPPPAAPAHDESTAGVLAIIVAVVIFSLATTMIRKSGSPGVVVAFWRLVIGTVIWFVVLRVQRRQLSWATIRRVAPLGVLFGANLGLFFAAVNHTRIANVEFIGAMSPVIVIPVAAVVFHERIAARALAWGALAVVGVALIIFAAPGAGERGLTGDLMAATAVGAWAGYLLLSRRVRATTGVSEVMAVTALGASLFLLPFALASGEAFDVTAEGWAYIATLAVLTGTAGHGLVLWAQRRIPVSTISVLTLAQPALATTWAYVFLDESVRPLQVVGMVVVLLALLAFTRSATRPVASEPGHGELGGTPG